MNTKTKQEIAKKLFKSIAAFAVLNDAEYEKIADSVLEVSDIAFDLLGVPGEFRTEFDPEYAAGISDKQLDNEIKYLVKAMKLEKKHRPKLFKNM